MRVGAKERFLIKTKLNHITNCWEWLGSKNHKGYGSFYFNRKTQNAHRVSYQLFKKSIPAHMLVCHTCDNPSCVNPEHLWLGTYKENSTDMVIKNRSIRSEEHNFTKFSKEIVHRIRMEYRNNLTQYEISKKYGVSQSNISRILANKIWRNS